MSPRSPEVRVVGAGVAGLAAAWQLQRAGVSVEVLDRGPRIGGRAARDESNGSGVSPPWLTPRHRHLIGWLAELAGPEAAPPWRPLAPLQLHAGRLLSVHPTGALGVAALPGVPRRALWRLPRLGRLLRRFAAALDPARPERAAALDDRSVADFGRLYFGQAVVESWMEPGLADAGLEDAERVSRVAFLLQHALDHWMPTATLRSPLSASLAPLAQVLPVRLSSAAVSIEAGPAGVWHLSVRTSARASRIETDAVVLAVPAGEAARLAAPVLGSFERRFLAGVRYRPLLAARVGTARPPVRMASHVRLPRREAGPFFRAQLEPPGLCGPEEPGGALLVQAREAWSRTHLDAPLDVLRKELVRELAIALPKLELLPETLRVERDARGLPDFRVGFYRELARFSRLQEEERAAGRRLYFAGDYLVSPNLEGAVTSGLRAAAAVLEDLGLAPPLTREAPRS